MISSVSNEGIEIIKTSRYISVGERLRLARESKKLSIVDVASQLMFTEKTIIHMEGEKWDKLYGRAYARGYFLSYVKILDMPQNEMLVAFNIEYESMPSNSMRPQFSIGRNNYFLWLFILLIVIVILIMSFAYTQWKQSQNFVPNLSITKSYEGQSKKSTSELSIFNGSLAKMMRMENFIMQVYG